jgi:hypothetical protein
MATIFDPATNSQLLARLSRLTPEARPAWGRMTAPQMVAHLIESGRLASGELVCASKRLPIRFFPINSLIVRCAPFPKNAPTAPELLARRPATWEGDVAELSALVGRLAARSPREAWPEHPAFGKLSGKTWGVLVYRHVDHHLHQFGV